MPLYAGYCSGDITPPLGVWMSGYALRSRGATGVHDPLLARAIVWDNGHTRLALLVADLIAFPPDLTERLRQGIAQSLNIPAGAVMLHATHTHGGPYIGLYRAMGTRDGAYENILCRKMIGFAQQAADTLQPVHLTYGEGAAQIGVNRRRSDANGRAIGGHDYAAPVAPIVQTLCVNGADGRMIAQLFCHACHPTTMGGDNLQITAEWPGAAAALLRTRFLHESAETGVTEDALPIPLVGCCGDINPVRRGGWQAVEDNGRMIAEAAHTARWNAHGRLSEDLNAVEATVDLPLLPPPSPSECEELVKLWETTLTNDQARNADVGRLLFDEAHLSWARASLETAAHPNPDATLPFTIQCFNLGGVRLLGFPAEMFVQYQLDFAARSRSPVLTLGCTNGCWNYVPTAAEFARGGYEVEEAYKYYATPMFGPECESLLRAAAYLLLEIEDSDTTPYPLLAGPPRKTNI